LNIFLLSIKVRAFFLINITATAKTIILLIIC